MGGRTLMDRESPAKTIDVARVGRRVARIRAGLRRRILESGLSQNEVERRCGWSRGYLSQVLAGRINLAVRHLVSVSLSIGNGTDEFSTEEFTQSVPAALTELLNRRDGKQAVRRSGTY